MATDWAKHWRRGYDNLVWKTWIMRFANLSYKLLEKYLSKTLDADLVCLSDGSFQITEKGLLFLERFETFSSRYAELEREQEEISFEREVLERMCDLPLPKSINSGRWTKRR